MRGVRLKLRPVQKEAVILLLSLCRCRHRVHEHRLDQTVAALRLDGALHVDAAVGQQVHELRVQRAAHRHRAQRLDHQTAATPHAPRLRALGRVLLRDGAVDLHVVLAAQQEVRAELHGGLKELELLAHHVHALLRAQHRVLRLTRTAHRHLQDANHWRGDFQAEFITQSKHATVLHVKTAVQVPDRHVVAQQQRRCEDNRGSLHRNARDVPVHQEERRSRGRFRVAVIHRDVHALASEERSQ